MTALALPPSTWHSSAACLDVGPALFEPDDYSSSNRAQINAAKQVCLSCPVIELCLRDAIAEDDQATIRGGMTPKQRQKIAGPKRPKEGVGKGGHKLAPCGTFGAYKRHRARGEECDPCREGAAQYERDRRARKRARRTA
jgi:WhiB family redox-sensing transcriptional regulator